MFMPKMKRTLLQRIRSWIANNIPFMEFLRPFRVKFGKIMVPKFNEPFPIITNSDICDVQPLKGENQ